VIHVTVVSPIQAVRSGLRAMLNEKSPDSQPGDFSSSLVISDAPVLGEVEHWLNEVDVLALTDDAATSDELERLTAQDESHFAVLLLTADPQKVMELSRLSVHAWGVLALDCSTAELNAAVRAVHEGLLVSSPGLIGAGLARQLSANPSASGLTGKEMIEPLTQRETEVLELLAQGLANKQIAARLNISEHTVKFHVSSIYTKLGVASRTEAVRTGVQQGLISL
jgi:NarL family two-component system response regulator YdfI